MRTFLEEILSAEKIGNSQEIAALVKQTEIPDYRHWFYTTYPADKAESWIGPYEQGLEENNETFKQLFARLGKTSGQIVIRKANDEPEPGKGMEWGMLDSAKSPLDTYFASWKPDLPSDSHTEPIGYFIFIDGMFRWDSLIHAMWPRFEKSPPAAVKPREKESPVSGPAFKVGDSRERTEGDLDDSASDD